MNKLLLIALVGACFALATASPFRAKRAVSRAQARANYNLVVEELNNRFRGYLENCFPKPKGCTCVIGTDKNGRQITERRRNDDDCHEQPDSGNESDGFYKK